MCRPFVLCIITQPDDRANVNLLLLMYTNTHSVLSEYDELGSFISDSSTNVLILIETWLGPDVGSNEIFVHASKFQIS